MFPAPFALERFFARHEFSARHLLSTSDSQGLAMAGLLASADDGIRARWEGLRLGYTESQGLPELRTEIALLYERAGEEEILVAAPEEAIFLAMNALLRPGDHVICTFPGYQSLYELARVIGCRVALWEPRESDAWRFDPDDLAAMIEPDTKLVIWNFPHNPTGALPSAEDAARMIAISRSAGTWVFSDEMYRLLEPEESVRLPAAVDRYEKAVSLGGVSKAFGLAGLRIGWLATRDAELMETMKSLKDYTTICSSAPSELLALMGLRDRERILTVNRDRIERNRGLALDFFERNSGRFSWLPPAAGTVCFPRVNEGAEAFCARVLNDTGVLLLPSTVYGYGDHHFRLGLGRDDFGAGLEVFDGYLQRGGSAESAASAP